MRLLRRSSTVLTQQALRLSLQTTTSSRLLQKQISSIVSARCRTWTQTFRKLQLCHRTRKTFSHFWLQQRKWLQTMQTDRSSQCPWQAPALSAVSAWIFFFISGRCIFQHLFFFLVITDLIRKHLIIKETAAADFFLYLRYLFFIWIDSYFYCPVYFSHPDFLYTDGLILFLWTHCSCFIIIYLFYKNKCFYELFEQICSKVNSSLHQPMKSHWYQH